MMFLLTPNMIYVGIPHLDEQGVAVDVVDCAMRQITSIEPINGKPTKAKR